MLIQIFTHHGKTATVEFLQEHRISLGFKAELTPTNAGIVKSLSTNFQKTTIFVKPTKSVTNGTHFIYKQIR